MIFIKILKYILGYLNGQVKSELSKFNMKDVNALKLVATHATQFTSLAQLKAAVHKASPQLTILGNKAATKATAQ